MSSYVVANLLDKLKSSDSDFRYYEELKLGILRQPTLRFMALTDLCFELCKPQFSFDSHSEQKMIEAVKNSLLDTNSEVQNNAIKCLIESDQDAHRDIGAMSLKILINEVPEQHPELGLVLKFIVPGLLKVISQFQAVDVVEVVKDALIRFGIVISGFDNAASLQQAIMQEMLNLLTHHRQVVRKKAISVIASLAPIAFDDIFTKLSHGILSQMQSMATENDFEKLITILDSLATLSKVSAERMTPLMASLVKSTISYSSFESDELKEQCLLSLEVFVQTSVIEDLDGIVKTGIEYLAYDPNYIQDDEMDVDEDDEDGDEYSDDEDVSWKVRRAAVKLIASVMIANPDWLPKFYENISPLLIKRFSERQENVRIEVVNSYISIVQATKMLPKKPFAMPMIKRRKGSRGENVHVTDSAINLLRTQIPGLITALQRLFDSKSVQTILVSFQLLKAIVETAQCGLESKFSNLILPVQNGLSARDVHTNTNIKIEVLEFLSVVIKYHDIQVVGPHLKDLVEVLGDGCQDKFYKVRAESLKIFGLLTSTYCQQDKMNRYDDSKFVHGVYDIIWGLITGDEIEVEVLEMGILTIANVLADIGDLLDQDRITKVLMHLQMRIQSETMRMVAIKAISTLCASKTGLDREILVKLLEEIRPLLLKSNRYSSTEAIICMIGLLERCTDAVDVVVYQSLLDDLKGVIDQSQVQMIPLGLDLLRLVLTFGSGHAKVVEGFKVLIPKVIEVIVQAPHVVAGGAGLTSLLELWQVTVGLDSILDTFGNGISKLLELASTRTDISKEAFAVMAKCVGKAGCQQKVGKAVSEGKLKGLVENFLTEIHGKSGEQLQIFSLNCLGELGMEADMKSFGGDFHQDLEQLIKTASDDVKTASALALGRMAISNIPFYLPFVIERAKVKSQEYYYVLTLNEIIVSSVSHQRLKKFEPFVEELWNLLLNMAQEITEEGTRSIVSDCLGKLLLTNPKTFLPQLQKHITSPSETVRATAVTAFRYTLSQTFEEYDNLLMTVLSSFLKLLQDPALIVRKMALSALNSCLHSKPHLLVSSLSEVTTMLYKETVFKPELVVIVQMGPFQHKVDNGLDNRKIALDCMSSLLDHHHQLKIQEFISHLTSSLSDPALEIKISTHSIFQKLVKIYPSLDLDSLIAPLRESVFIKTKDTAVKQQIEENKSLVFSALKTVCVLDSISNKDPKKEWSKFMNEIRGPESSVSALFKELTI